MSNFRAIDRQTAYLLPPSVDDWLPEDHLARFVVDVVDQLDVSAMSNAYRGSGSASQQPPAKLVVAGFNYTGAGIVRTVPTAHKASPATSVDGGIALRTRQLGLSLRR